MTMRDIINSITPATASARICLDGELLAEFDDLNQQLSQLEDWESSSLSDEDPRAPLRARLLELRERMRASEQKFTFRTIGDKASSDLLAKHPPPKNEDGDEDWAWNPQTYPAAFVAACSLDPVMTEAEVGEAFDGLNLNQRSELFAAAMRANNREVDIPFSAAVSE